MPFVVGLTGGIGSGKSAAAALFAGRGVLVVDTDAIAHELTSPGGEAIGAIRAEFGPEFIGSDGALDRPRMRSLVFRDPGARRRLERILHPRIQVESDRRIGAAETPYAVLVVPLLVEGGMGPDSGRFQRILVVDCPEPIQVQRVMRRSRMTEEEVLRIVASQAPRAQRLAAADDTIDNSAAIAELEPQVEALHRRYLALAADRERRGRGI